MGAVRCIELQGPAWVPGRKALGSTGRVSSANTADWVFVMEASWLVSLRTLVVVASAAQLTLPGAPNVWPKGVFRPGQS